MTKQHFTVTSKSNIFASASQKSFCQLALNNYKKKILRQDSSKMQTLLTAVCVGASIFCLTFLSMAIF